MSSNYNFYYYITSQYIIKNKRIKKLDLDRTRKVNKRMLSDLLKITSKDPLRMSRFVSYFHLFKNIIYKASRSYFE